jgi:hypothetical protein
MIAWENYVETVAVLIKRLYYQPLEADWLSFASVYGLWAVWDNIYECVCCYNRHHGMVIIRC